MSKTIKDKDGKILFFGLEDFLRDIAKGECCFICGAEKGSKKFNNEHVLPDWILSRFQLYSKAITLPNDSPMPYRKYTIPCCVECNTELGKTYETPISELLIKSYEEVADEISKNPAILKMLFKWLCLIFVKTHLKDKELLIDRDLRKKTGKIGDTHYWEDLHHIHCIARSHYTQARIDPLVYGTILIFPALQNEKLSSFDYMDTPIGNTAMIQINEFCIVAVLDDTHAGSTLFMDIVNRITGPLSPFQLREIVAHLNCININLKERPVFYSTVNEDGEYFIGVEIPENCILLPDEETTITPGQCLKHYVKNLINVENKEEILIEIESGEMTYLFDLNGDFINHSKTNSRV